MRAFARFSAVLCLLFSVSTSSARELPNIDALGAVKKNPAAEASVAQRARGLARAGSAVQVESRLGVPTFVWAGHGAPVESLRPVVSGDDSAEAAARAHLSYYASLYGLSTVDVTSADAVSTRSGRSNAPDVIKFRQRINGVEVFREELSVLMKENRDLVAIAGYISSISTGAARQNGMTFSRDNRTAIADAFSNLTGRTISLSPAGSRGGYEYFTAGADAGLVEPIRAKPVYFNLGGGLEAGYYIEIAARENATDSVRASDENTLDYYSYVISAVDGSILFRKNLTEQAITRGKIASNGIADFTYRVWADTSGDFVPMDGPQGNSHAPKVNPIPDGFQASFIPPVDVTLTNIPFSRSATDPWLAPGSTATVGNNVDAYADLVTPDGYGPVVAPMGGTATGDFRAQITAPGVFGHTYSNSLHPNATAEQRQAAIVQLFFNNNWLHDWFYDSGFDEAAGNAQTDNYGRGGLAADSLKAEAQDFSGRNNANMSTPADGLRPRMQMYVFDENVTRYVDVLSPAAASGKRSIGTGQFGAQVFDLTGTVVMPSPAHGCTAASFADPAVPGGVSGKIVMVDREPTATCSIGTKLNNAMAAGASAFILVNLSTTPDTLVNVTGSLPSFTIPFVSITWNGAASIKTALAGAQTVTARVRRDAATVDRDGTIDNTIVAHEWGHYLSNRLVANSAGLNTNHSRGMGEGWGDFTAMMMSVRADDITVPSNADWAGVYALSGYVSSGNGMNGPNEGYYYGIRRYPYSTDLTKNPLTFRHIADNQALPVGPPNQAGSVNSEVHNTGEVWASMLWECYASLLRDTVGASPRLTFTQAQTRMKQYLVASLKMTPPSPTFVEARDAVLAAAYANDGVDYQLFLQAFAKRGIGFGAVAPDRYTANNNGVVESFVVGSDLTLTGVTIDDSVASCDNDGVLDAGETGKITVTLKNTGNTALSATTGTISTTNPNVTIANGGALTFAPSDPYGTTTATVNLSMLTGTAGVQLIDFTLTYNDTALTVAGPRNGAASLRGNSNVVPSASATDTVEAPREAWTATSTIPYASFRRTATTGTSYRWHGDNSIIGSDVRLTSPIFTVDGSGSLNVQFDHTWGFEFDGGGNYDGGVVELSVNGGAFTDIGSSAYNGTILNYTGSVNPLKGRQGFVANGGPAHTSLTQAIAPGSTAQIRFRIGSDSSLGAPGWDIDNIAFTGVVETPFDVLVADPGCTATTSTTVSASPSPATFGASVTITATVSSPAGAPTGGMVTFKDGATTLGTGAVTAGVATYSTSALSIGSHTLTAQYAGTAGFTASNSAPVALQVNKAATAVALGTSLTPAVFGAPVTFTATVTSSSTPVGSVTFLDGATPIGTASLNGSGVATLTTSALAAGSHSITAQYGGNATFASSVSTVTTQVVHYTTSTGLVSSANPSFAGSSVTFTATITTAGPTPTGSVEFFDGASSLAIVPLTGNAAGFTTSGLSSGSHSISAVYSGASGYQGSTSITVNQTVNGLPVIAAPATAKGLEGNATISITITRSGVTTGSSSVNYATSAGTATSPADFTAASSSVTFNAGETSKVIDVTLAANDTVREGAKSFTLTLSTPTGATLGNATVTVTLLDDDARNSDFNGDGKNDVVLRNQSNGLNAAWLLNGTSFTSIVDLPSITDVNVRIEGTADFNGDGKADLLLRNYSTGANQIQLMDGATVLSTVNLPPIPNTAIQFAGTADMNRDQKTDILIRNTATGKNAVWIMNGTTYSGVVDLPALPNLQYVMESSGDFNGDGYDDILFRNYTTGHNAVWLMNGYALGSVIDLPGLADLTFRFDGIHDFNHDGNPDIIVRNYTSGNNAIWMMNGAALSSVVDLPALSNIAYEIVGPR